MCRCVGFDVLQDTHTHSRFTALCPGLPGWAVTRRDIHPLTPETCCGSLSSFWILRSMRKIINRGRCTDNPAGRHPIRTIDAPISIECPSCRNPPNLSWLGTGTKYAGLHIWRLGYVLQAGASIPVGWGTCPPNIYEGGTSMVMSPPNILEVMSFKMLTRVSTRNYVQITKKSG